MPLALFLLCFPAASLAVRGGASALSLIIAVVCLVMLIRVALRSQAAFNWDATDTWITLGLASPIVVVLVIEACHGKLVGNTLDSPSRFLAAVPVFLMLRRVRLDALRTADLSFAIGAIVALIDMLASPRVEDRGRNAFLDAIHFGDIALALGILSVLSLGWWRKDPLIVRIVKIAGLGAGLAASAISGSRGGWIAIPVMAVIVALTHHGRTARRWKIVVTLAIGAVVVVGGLMTTAVHDRFAALANDYSQFEAGNKDTSLGVRLQLYRVGLKIVAQHPWEGLGAHGFHDAMPGFAQSGALTPLAAHFGMGETHNQFLAWLTDYGVLGGLALVAIYLVPCIVFVRSLHSPHPSARRSSTMGLAFVVSFLIFGFSVEMFDLKLVTAFYATVVAVLLSISANQHAQHLAL